MSDPTRTYTQPLGQLQQELARMPYPTGLGRLTEEKCPYSVPERVVEAAERGRLDLQFRASVVLPLAWCADENVRAAKKEQGRLARSDTGALQVRSRSAMGVKLAAAVTEGMEREAEIKAGLGGKVAAGGGAHLSFGRLLKYYPQAGAGAALHPPDRLEAFRAYRRCGLPQGEAVKSLPLMLVKVNKTAENGFPVLKKGTDADALARAVELATQIRTTLQAAPDLTRALEALDRDNPSFFLLRGKAKYDMYSVAKVEGHELRFYNVVGRQLTLLMQQVTQPFEEKQQPVPASNSTWGLPLVRGGGEAIVSYLEAGRSGARDVAYVHHGDDTWMVVRRGGRTIMFAMDCSSFDLTQHSAVTEAVHQVFWEQLDKVDAVSAAIWHKLMRRRRVTVSGTVVCEMTHGGPSGMPLQSKVNDVLMEIYCARLAVAIDAEPALTEEKISRMVEVEGKALGFVVRLEQYSEWEGDLRAALARRHFVYLGYEFRCKPDGEVYLTADLPRMIVQLPYPTLGGYEKVRAVHLARTALKCAGVLVNAGALWELRDMERVYEMAASWLADAAGELSDAEISEELMSAAISGIYEALGPQSLAGLTRVLTVARLKELWQDPRLDKIALGDWGDEPEDLRVRERGEVLARLTGKQPPEQRLRPQKPRQDLECTKRQVGRLPPRPAQEARVRETGRPAPAREKRKGGRRLAQQWPESESEEDWEDEEDDDSVWEWS